MASPIMNIVISCADGTWTGERWEGPPRELAEFYADLLGMRILREDWLVVGHDREIFPRLAFDGLEDYRPPGWHDPERPQQVHLDLAVPDLGGAEATALRLGGTRLGEEDDRTVFADPAGHQVCLRRDLATPKPRIDRVVFDCFSPRSLAAFYLGLFPTSVVLDEAHRVGVGGADEGPALAFHHVSLYTAPRWPDPAYPQQLHVDFDVPDGPAMQERAARLGAIRLPEMGGSCPVYADPAGHPFCLCWG